MWRDLYNQASENFHSENSGKIIYVIQSDAKIFKTIFKFPIIPFSAKYLRIWNCFSSNWKHQQINLCHKFLQNPYISTIISDNKQKGQENGWERMFISSLLDSLFGNVLEQSVIDIKDDYQFKGRIQSRFWVLDLRFLDKTPIKFLNNFWFINYEFEIFLFD